MREEAVAVRLVEGRVIVTRFDFAPGAETGWHRHGDDGVITAITDCQMRLEEPAREVPMPAGSACRRDAGVGHNGINAGTVPMRFMGIGLKG